MAQLDVAQRFNEVKPCDDELEELAAHMRGLLQQEDTPQGRHSDLPARRIVSATLPACSKGADGSLVGAGRPLIVDALNYLNFFTGGGRHQKDTSATLPWAQVAILRARTRGFVHACEESGFAAEFVVDAGWQTAETAAKWKGRREEEVREASRFLPLGMDVLLCDALVEAGARVYRAVGLDGDDVIARMAEEAGEGALILSADRDMFRYPAIRDAHQRQPVVHVDFELSRCGRRLLLVPSRYSAPKPGVCARDVSTLPYTPAAWLRHNNKLYNALTRPEDGYVRGCCSPFVRSHGNLHAIARPLRLAAYAAIGVSGAVRESYPEWDEEAHAVVWVDELVLPDSTLLHLLREPVLALDWLERHDPAAQARQDNPLRSFARVSLVAELVDAIRPQRECEEGQRARSILTVAEEIAGAEAKRALNRAARDACVWPPWAKVALQAPHQGTGNGIGRGWRGGRGARGGRAKGDGFWRGRGQGRGQPPPPFSTQ